MLSLWYGSRPYWLVRKASFLLMESLKEKQTYLISSKIACLILNKLSLSSESCAISKSPILLKVIVKIVNLSLSILYISVVYVLAYCDILR